MEEKETKTSIFREKSITRVSSPEQLNDYIRVTTPSVWIVLIALVLLMIVRFERFAAGAGKLQLPYLIWLCFAAYLNLATWLLNR